MGRIIGTAIREWERGIEWKFRKKIEALRKEIEYHIERYYNQDDPEITDYEYDQKMNELKRLEREHPEYVTGFPDTKGRRKCKT